MYYDKESCGDCCEMKERMVLKRHLEPVAPPAGHVSHPGSGLTLCGLAGLNRLGTSVWHGPDRIVRALLMRLCLWLTVSILASLTLPPCYGAEIYKIVGSEAGRFLTIYADARGEALGQASSAVADGISNVCWNPAGLAFAEGIEVLDQGHLLRPLGWDPDWTSDVDFKFVGAAMGIGSVWRHIPLGTISVWRKSVDYASIIEHEDMGDRTLGHLDELAIGVTYAHLIRGVFGIGVTCKHISSEWGFRPDGSDPSGLATRGYSGTGWDVGLLYRNTFRITAKADLGISAAFGERNLGRVRITGSGGKVKYNLPERHFIGIAPSVRLRGGDLALTLALERTLRKEDLNWSSHIGAELLILEGIAIRAGRYEAEETSESVNTVGLGICLRYGRFVGITYDWAHSKIPSDAVGVHRHALSVSLLRVLRGIDLKPLLRYE